MLHPARIVTIAALLAAGIAALSACESPASTPVQRLCPPLTRELAQALTVGDDRQLRRLSHERGRSELAYAFAALVDSSGAPSLPAFTQRKAVIAPALRKLGDRLAEDHRSPQHRRYVRYLDTLTDSDRFEIHRLRSEAARVLADTAVTEADQVAQGEAVIAALSARGDTLDALLLEGALVPLYVHRGMQEVAISRLEHALELARAFGSPVMVSQFAGSLGQLWADRGDLPRMWRYWAEAKDAAREHGLGALLARITMREAMYYEVHGQLPLAADLYQAAEQECREFDGGPAELRFVLASMRFAAGLGAWDLVVRELPRARALCAQWDHGVFAQDIRVGAYELCLLEAGFHMSRGRVREAEKLYRQKLREFRDGASHHRQCKLLMEWSRGLLQNGRPEQALPLATQAVGLLVAHKLTEYLEAPLLLARAQVQWGAIDAAQRSLAAFDSISAVASPSPLFEARPFAVSIERSVLGVEILRAGGNKAAAGDSLARSVAALSRATRELSADEHAALYLAEAEDLHGLLHRLGGGDPQRSYRLECAWKQLLALHGPAGSAWAETNRRRALHEIQRLLTASGATGGAVQPAARDAALGAPLAEGVEHWLYCLQGDGVVRWVASAQGVTRDSLAVSSRQLQRDIERALRAVHESNGPKLSRGAQGALGRLAEQLLPRGPDGTPRRPPGRVLVTPARSLMVLPFELLDLTGTAHGYEPLLERADVAYLRFDASSDSASGERAGTLVVADPELSEHHVRQHSGLRPLPRARREGERAAALLQPAVTLTGSRATKPNMLRHWESVRTLYYAGHVVRDANLPFCSFLPLAAAEGLPAESAYLGMADVRRADFSGCDLVVLSACGGGAAYVTAESAAPGLGEAFLDAGARAVIHSFWDVRDEDAERLMGMFLERWQGGAVDPVAALCAARREAMRAGGELADPRVWGSVGIGLGSIPRSAAGSGAPTRSAGSPAGRRASSEAHAR